MKAKGFDPGPIDGIMGPKTTSALKDFQKREGLQVTGHLNAETQGPARTAYRDVSKKKSSD